MVDKELCKRVVRHVATMQFQEDAPHDIEARKEYAHRLQSNRHLIEDSATQACERKDLRQKLNKAFAACILKSNDTRVAKACEHIHGDKGASSLAGIINKNRKKAKKTRRRRILSSLK